MDCGSAERQADDSTQFKLIRLAQLYSSVAFNLDFDTNQKETRYNRDRAASDAGVVDHRIGIDECVSPNAGCAQGC